MRIAWTTNRVAIWMYVAFALGTACANERTLAERRPPRTKEELVSDYFQGWNVRSLDQVVGGMKEDVIYEDPFSKGPIPGKPAVRDYFAKLLEQFQRLSIHLERFDPEAPECRASDGPPAVLGARYQVDGAMSNGTEFHNKGLDCFSFSDGMIQSLRAY